ncbi:hypothetical protein KIPB_010658 [Kipferlia bialata]|uniref:Uncharacterized protein n=1 Tax=Kipferlia bialata TaxID=797122 RepID=A0A391NQ13_9EUKA|nr:hypothetical protein KIPB_010658 [Kipferlia bialata]|eukprot:g10658.t1
MYSVLIVGYNSANPANNSIIVTRDASTGSISSEMIDCPIPDIVQYAPATRVGDTVYVFGGCNNGDALTISDKVWGQVERQGPWPEARWFHSAFSLDGMLYIAGGCGVRDCWCYHPDTGVWTQMPDAPEGFGLSATVEVGDTVHFIGSEWNMQMHLTFSVTGGWVREPDLPFQCMRAGAVCVDEDIYILGGYCTPSQVWHYSTHAREWSVAGQLPIPARQCRACLIGPRTVLVCSDTQMMVGDVS